MNVTDDPAVLAAEIRQARKVKKWTQEELADQAQVSVRTVRNLEAGREVSPGTLGVVLRSLGREPEPPTFPDDVAVITNAIGYRLIALPAKERAALGGELIRLLMSSASTRADRSGQ